MRIHWNDTAGCAGIESTSVYSFPRNENWNRLNFGYYTSGTADFTPTVDGIYTFTISCSGGLQRSAIVQTPSPLSLHFQTTQNTIRRSETSFLFWDAQGATSCLGSNGVPNEVPRLRSGARRPNTPDWGQSMHPQSEFPTKPRTTTTYTMTCYDNAGRSVTQSQTIQVLYDTTIRSFNHHREYTSNGTPIDSLSWVTWDATDCIMSGGSFGTGTNVPRSSRGYRVNSLGTVYTLSCTNPSGGAGATQTVTVN